MKVALGRPPIWASAVSLLLPTCCTTGYIHSWNTTFIYFPKLRVILVLPHGHFQVKTFFLSTMCTAKAQISCTFAESDDRLFTIKCIVHMH